MKTLKIALAVFVVLALLGCGPTSKSDRVKQATDLAKYVVFVRHPSGIVFAISCSNWFGSHGEPYNNNTSWTMTVVPQEQVPLLEDEIVDLKQFLDNKEDQ